MKLTDLVLAQACDGAQRSSISKLVLSYKELHEVSLVKSLTNLERLDLSHNCLESIEVLSNLRGLKWLSVAGNRIKSLSGVESLSNLMVLNASSNVITGMKEVEGLLELRALIVNDNQIASICKLDKLTALNTLVLSKNPISSLGTSLEKSASLVKLSLSNCELQDLSSLKSLVDLKELRLSHNKIKRLSKDLKKNIQLRIVDLGNNRLQEISDIKVLGTLPFLKNINLKGNPICLRNDYTDKMKSLLPNLKILDCHALVSTGKKRSSEDHSDLSKRGQLDKRYLEESHTVKKIKRLREGVKATHAQEDDLSKDNLHEGKKSKQDKHASKMDQRELKGNHAVKKLKWDQGAAIVGVQEDHRPKDNLHKGKKTKLDKDKLMSGSLKVVDGAGSEEHSRIPKKSIINTNDSNGEEVWVVDGFHERKTSKRDKDQPKRKGHKADIAGNEAPTKDDDKPFIELIGAEEPKIHASKDFTGTQQKKDISGIVSIVHNKTKASKHKSKHNPKMGSLFSISLPQVEIGAGGISSWD